MGLWRILLFVLPMLGLWRPLALAADDGVYLGQLVARAQREHLAERPEWRALLHYRPLLLSRGMESEVDAPTFFLAANGKFNPQDELIATLQSFAHSSGDDPDKSAQCLFPARYHWLDQVLKFEPDKLPRISCRRFQRWFQEMNPGRLTLVFPAAYLNNPASMFGHTLLRVDPPGDNEQPPLLAYTINYAADTRQQKGFSYAYRGLFGGYRGRYSIAPYYAAVKTYGDIENRDIWEYRLNLDREEIAQLLRHAWEMRSAWFDYYFLDKNCSYHMLSLLESARPGLRLTRRFSGWTIPSETVRAVAEAGLVQEVSYRPARNTVLQQRTRLVTAGEQELAMRISRGVVAAAATSLGALSPAEQAKVLELSTDFLRYQDAATLASGEQNAARVSELLLARSRLAVPGQTPAIALPEVWPGAGHKPAMARLGYGIEDRRQYVELAGGPAYHDTLDPEGGFTRGSRLDLLRAALRYYPEESKGELERLDVIDIRSLSSWDRFFHPVSWEVALGVERKERSVSDRPLLGKVNVGAGISHDFSKERSAYVFAEGTLEMSNRFSYFVAPGVGTTVGMGDSITSKWRAESYFSCQLFFLHEWRADLEAGLHNRLTIDMNNIAALDLQWKREFGHSFPAMKVYWQRYF